ncbi:MAG: CHC2 zinc finger domain-containing protein [Isosphaeraceae bacterium]
MPSDPWTIPVSSRRADWKAERHRIDLAKVATDLLGPAPGRRGDRGRLWWRCPIHPDKNPSLLVDAARGHWRCFGCGESGDAASLVMRVLGKTFPEALEHLTGRRTVPRKAPGKFVGAAISREPARPSGLAEEDALALVEASVACLWSNEGADALAYLTGPDRGLHVETIRAVSLGWTPGVNVPKAAGGTFRTLGVVIPWFIGDRLALVKIRQPDGRRPKYAEAYRDPSRVVCYPSPEVIQPGRPLIVTEGEFDALALGAALGDRTAVVTLGGATSRPEPAFLLRCLHSAPWFVATDADVAGDGSAAAWPPRARRVRPPGSFKDWSEAKAGGVNLARWWGEVLQGNPHPPLFSWDELARWRWSGSAESDANLVVDRPDHAGVMRALVEALADEDDPERRAIRSEGAVG